MEKRQHIQASVTLNQPQSDTHVMLQCRHWHESTARFSIVMSFLRSL